MPENKIARDVLDSLLEGCQVIGFDWTYLYLNDAAVKHAQRPREELLGRTMMECYPGIAQTPMFEVLRRCMTDRTHDVMENEFTYPDGSTGWFELRFVPVPEGACILSLDVTERKRAAEVLHKTEEQLRHAQKMEAVGRLAGGVAHDFNNLLSVVLSYSDLVLADLKSDDPIHGDISEIAAAGRRASELTRQLLAFSRQQIVQLRVIDLNHVVAGMEKIIGRLLGADVEVAVLRSSRLGRVQADPGSLEQILMNLVVNARDAMPGGGKLTIQTKDVILDEDYAREHVEVTPGPYVMLVVSDTGLGMNKETQHRIFEPFFTTKAKDRGTGLGLSTVFGIVKQFKGHIWIYSEPDKGTTFKLYFPRTDAPLDAATSTPPVSDSLHGTGTILLVEDDDQVRTVAIGILRRLGYTVVAAASPGEAILAAEQHEAKIDLLLTDIVLPRMSGPQLVKRLLAVRPELKVLFMSGYTDEAVLQHGVLDSDAAFVQKPLTPTLLARRVREVLGGGKVADDKSGGDSRL